MNVADIIKEDDVTLCVRVEFSEGRSAFLKIYRPSLKDVQQGQPFRRAETGRAIVHNAVSSNMLCSHLINTATDQENSTKIMNAHKNDSTFI